MTNAQNKIIKNYKREIRYLFPIFTKNEKRFFIDICNTITDYTTDNEDFTLESLTQNIGEPKDIVSRYLLDMDGEILRKSLSRNQYVRFSLVIIAFVIILLSSKQPMHIFTGKLSKLRFTRNQPLPRRILRNNEYFSVKI